MKKKNCVKGLLILLVFIGAILWKQQLSGHAEQGSLTVSDFVNKVESVTLGSDQSSIDTVLISNYKDLIYLSNVNPQYYQNATIQITTAGELDITQKVEGLSYEGLGSQAYPFAGIFTTNAGIGINLKLKSALFNAVYGTVKPPQISAPNTQKITYIGTGTGIIAEQVIFPNSEVGVTFEWNTAIKIQGKPASIINKIVNLQDSDKQELNPTVQLTVNLDESNLSSVEVVGDSSTGFICGELGKYINLDISQVVLPTTLIVKSNKGNAGGLVGTMGEFSKLIRQDTIAFESLNISGTESVGGLVGEANSPSIVTSLDTVASSEVPSSGSPNIHIKSVLVHEGISSGGIYGTVTNSADMTIDKQYCVESVIYENTKSGKIFGGLIGTYSAANIEKDLTITQVNTNGGTSTSIECNQKASTLYYGGLIGQVGKDAYVRVDNTAVNTNQTVTSSNKGGLIAYVGPNSIIDVQDITTVTSTYQVANNGYYGGVVGIVEDGGTLRLSGDTTVEGRQQRNNNYGRVVGNLKWALVYAEEGWSLNENGTASAIDNIGTNGDVIRNDKIGNIIAFDNSTNAIKIEGVSESRITEKQTINSVLDFAKLAIALQTKSANAGVLTFDIDFTGDIDLTETGIYGLTRSDGTDGTNPIQTYQGTVSGINVNGNSPIITLDIGGNLETGRGVYTKEHLGLFGSITGDTTFQNLKVDGNINIKQNSTNVNFGALAGLAQGNLTNTVQLSNLTLSPQIGYSNDDITLYGGSTIGQVKAMNVSIGEKGVADSKVQLLNMNIKNTGSVANNKCKIGGFIGNITGGGQERDKRIKVEIQDLTINKTSITMDKDNIATFGGFLGNEWTYVDVSIINNLVVDNSKINANHTGAFGGLIYLVNGSFVQEDKAIIRIENTSFSHNNGNGNSNQKYNGLIIGDAKNAYISIDKDSYKIGTNLNISMKNDIFDDIAGYNLEDLDNQNCGIISIRTQTENGEFYKDRDTYIYDSQLDDKYKSNDVRYYYNLETILGKPSVVEDNSSKWSDIDDGVISNIQELMLWSIRNTSKIGCIYWGDLEGGTYTITDNIDTTGYSYYPTTSQNNVKIMDAVITFDNEGINKLSGTSNTKGIEDNRNTALNDGNHYGMHGGILYSQKTGLDVVNLTLKGSISNSIDPSTTGALICNHIIGSKDKRTNVTISGVTLDGVKVYDYQKQKMYALLIHQISSYVNIDVSGVSTTGYSSDDKTNKVAAGLICYIGSKTTDTGINISFSDMALDGRVSNSIFQHASFAHGFCYGSDSTGTYNFTYNEAWGENVNSVFEHVTYGWEITESLRNPDQQLQYYDTDDYVSTTTKNADELQAEKFNTDQYLRYINLEQSDTQKELDVNLKKADLITGDGTYQYPYRITNGRQLQLVSEYFIREVPANDWIVCENAEREIFYKWMDGKWIKGTCDIAGDFTSSNPSETIEEETIRTHLLNAYYQIDKKDTTEGKNYDISMSPNYVGLGTIDNPFQGVIIGQKDEDIIVKYPENSNTHTEFGGLIKVSRGSVVKDLTIQLGNKVVTKSDTQQSDSITYFGGVIGTVLGGDNIIDNVIVKQQDNSVIEIQKSSNSNKQYERYASVGGYVGLIQSGGVIFKNMPNDQKNAYKEFLEDSYFYTNPYIGRVLDGFAININSDKLIVLNNGNDDYLIPTMQEQEESLKVIRESGKQTGVITIVNENGLYMLSAIINSGAGSNRNLDNTAVYVSTAYNEAKVRNGHYNNIGEDPTNIDSNAVIDDENKKNKIPYLIKHYTDGESEFYPATNIGHANARYEVKFDSTTYNMDAFGNGFRGIGARYTAISTLDNTRIHLGNVNKDSGKVVEIQYSMNVKEYNNDVFNVNSMGLFNYFYQDGAYSTDSENEVKNLKISGSNSIRKYELSGNEKLETSSDRTFQGMLAGSINKKVDINNFQCILDNIQMSEVDMYGGNYTGGMIGNITVECNIKIQESSINQYKIQSWERTGGILGSVTNAKITIIDTSVTNKNNDSTISRDLIEGKVIGGVIGYMDSKQDIMIKECRVGTPLSSNSNKQSLLIVGQDNQAGIILGGIIGQAYKKTATSKLALIENDINNIAISRPYTGSKKGSNWIGGVYGYASGKNHVIEDTNLQDNVIIGYGKTGGVIGSFTGSTSAYVHNIQWVNNILGNDLISTPTIDQWLEGTDINISANNIMLRKDKNVAKTYYNITREDTSLVNTGVFIGGFVEDTHALYITDVTLKYRTEDINGKTVALLPMRNVASQYDRNTFAENTTETEIGKEFEGYIQYNSTKTPLEKLEEFYHYQSNEEYLRNYNFSHNYFYHEGTEGQVPEAIQEQFTTFNEFHGLNVSDGDCPVLVIESNDSKEVTAMLKGYLDIILENGFSEVYYSSGWKRKNAPSNIEIKSYKADEGLNSSWQDEEVASLAYDAGSKEYFRVVPGQWDNDRERVTVIELTYDIKTVDDKGNVVDEKHIVKVPVVVKQIVHVDFKATVQEGTNFNLESYENISQKTLSNYGDKYTTLLEYGYTDYDWIGYLESGGSLLWNYQKEIKYLGQLPEGSELTLIDLNNHNQMYTYVVPKGGRTSVRLEDFVKNSFQAPGSTEKMQTVSLNDLLKLKVNIDNNGKWVAVESNQGTISSGEQWYRLAVPDELANGAIKKYTIQLPEENFVPTEQYYLTVKTPQIKETVETGLGIDYTTVFVENQNEDIQQLPYEIEKKSADESTCIIYQAISQNFTTKESTNVLLDSKGDKITLEYTNNISCSEDYYKFIQDNGERFLEISLEPVLMKNNIKNNVAFTAPIEATVEFKVTNTTVGNTSKGYTVTYNKPLNEMNFILGDVDQAYNIIKSFEKTGDKLYGCTVTTSIILDIPEVAMDMFPYSDITNLTEYIELNAKSKIAVQEENFRVTEGIPSSKGNKYYRNLLDMASLHYSVIDKTIDLGVNSLNLEKPSEPQHISTLAVYNTELISEETWNRVEKIQCKLTLYDKSSNQDKVNGMTPYTVVEDGWLNKYLTIKLQDSNGTGTEKILTESEFTVDGINSDNFAGYYHSDSQQLVLPLELYVTPDLNNINYKYSNYMVAIHITLLGEGNVEIIPEKVDYIRYTHANIPMQIVRNFN